MLPLSDRASHSSAARTGARRGSASPGGGPLRARRAQSTPADGLPRNAAFAVKPGAALSILNDHSRYLVGLAALSGSTVRQRGHAHRWMICKECWRVRACRKPCWRSGLDVVERAVALGVHEHGQVNFQGRSFASPQAFAGDGWNWSTSKRIVCGALPRHVDSRSECGDGPLDGAGVYAVSGTVPALSPPAGSQASTMS